MAELILFEDAEDLGRLYLEAALADREGFASVQALAGRLPQLLPTESVLVRRTGGPSRDLVTDLALLTLECRAATSGRAERIASMCRALMLAAERAGHMLGVPVYDVRDLSGVYEDPDPINPTVPRYSGTYQVAVRGSSV